MSEPNYHCPYCKGLSNLVISPVQALCTNEKCLVVTFDPSLPDGGASDPHEVDLSGLEDLFKKPKDQP